MASQNMYYLLGDDENDDPSDLLARANAAAAAPPAKAPPASDASGKKKQQQQAAPAAKLPSKPLPPAQAVKAQADGNRGRGGRGDRGGGRGSYGNRGRGYEGGFSRNPGYQGDQGGYGGYNDRRRSDNGFQGGRGGYQNGTFAMNGDSTTALEEAGENSHPNEGGRGRGQGRGRGRGIGFVADSEDRPRRREYDRRSGTGRGNEIKRNGAGRGNWGTELEQDALQESADITVVEEDKTIVDDVPEKKLGDETQMDPENKDEQKEEEEEDKEMTLDEYFKVMAEKRKPLEALKGQERKVTIDKDFESMQIVEKKSLEDDFLKLGSDKDKGKRKEILDKEERTRKPVSINEFLRPAEGEEYYSPGGRRGRGGRGRGGARGGFGGGLYSGQMTVAPQIEDPGHFPTLGAN